MSLGSATQRNDYTGDASTDTYSYTFKIFQDADLEVVQTSTANVETVLTLTNDYTVTGAGVSTGGTIVLTAGNLAANVKLVIRRKRTLTQNTDLRNQSTFQAQTVEDAFDHSVMIGQQQQDEIDRSLKAAKSEALAFDGTLPAGITTQTGRALIVDSAGTGFDYGPTADEIADAATHAATVSDAVDDLEAFLLSIVSAPYNATANDSFVAAEATANTTAIQSALDSGFKRIYIPKGTFWVDGPLTVPVGVSVIGTGVDTSILRVDTTDAGNFTSNDFTTTSPTFNQAILNTGSGFDQIADLDTDVKKGDLELSFDAAHGLAASDVIMFFDPNSLLSCTRLTGTSFSVGETITGGTSGGTGTVLSMSERTIPHKQIYTGDNSTGTYAFSHSVEAQADAPESLSEIDFATHATWDTTNDYDDTGGNATFTWSANQTSTLTQAEGNLATALLPNRWYRFDYAVTVSVAPDGDMATTLTTGVAKEAQTLDITAGSKTLYFKTNDNPGDFVISTTDTTATQGTFSIDDVSLKLQQMMVRHIDAATGVVSKLTPTTDFTISAEGTDGGGNVVLEVGSAYSTGAGFLDTGDQLTFEWNTTYADIKYTVVSGGITPSSSEGGSQETITGGTSTATGTTHRAGGSYNISRSQYFDGEIFEVAEITDSTTVKLYAAASQDYDKDEIEIWKVLTPATAVIRDLTVHGTEVAGDTYPYGAEVWGGKNSVFQNIYAKGFADTSIGVNVSYGCKVLNCKTEAVPNPPSGLNNYGIALRNSSKCIVSNGHFSSAWHSGLLGAWGSQTKLPVPPNRDNLFRDSVFENVDDNHALLFKGNSQGNTVIGCYCHGGFAFGGGGTRAIGNHFEGHHTGQTSQTVRSTEWRTTDHLIANNTIRSVETTSTQANGVINLYTKDNNALGQVRDEGPTRVWNNVIKVGGGTGAGSFFPYVFRCSDGAHVGNGDSWHIDIFGNEIIGNDAGAWRGWTDGSQVPIHKVSWRNNNFINAQVFMDRRTSTEMNSVNNVVFTDNYIDGLGQSSDNGISFIYIIAGNSMLASGNYVHGTARGALAFGLYEFAESEVVVKNNVVNGWNQSAYHSGDARTNSAIYIPIYRTFRTPTAILENNIAIKAGDFARSAFELFVANTSTGSVTDAQVRNWRNVHLGSDAVGGNWSNTFVAPSNFNSIPHLSLENLTSENTDGGRECQINFTGARGGAVRSTLARIQASHDGVSDDEKGDLIFYTNDGTDIDTPTERMRIDSAGAVTIADSSAGVDVNLDSSGATGIISQLDFLSDRPSNGQETGRIRFINNGATPIAQISADRGSSDTDGDLIVKTSNTERLRVHQEGYVDANVGIGIRNKLSTANISTPPTDAELDAEFGAPATVGTGFTALIDDNGAGSNSYIVWSDGTNWWHAAGTKAV